MQQPIPNLEDITDPITAMNMTLVLMAKAFNPNYSTPTNNNQFFYQTHATGRLHNRSGYNAVQNVENQVAKNAVQNLSVQNFENQNGLIVVPGIVNQNPNGNGNVVAARAEGNENENNSDIDEIEKVNANCILMANLQQASTLDTQTNKAPVYDSDGSAEGLGVEQEGRTVEQHPGTIEETRAYFESLYNNLEIDVENVNTVNHNTTKTRRPQPRSNTKNDRVPSASKSSWIKNKEVKVEEHHRSLLLSKNKKHMSSKCNNIKLAIQNDKSKVVCATCKQCLITANHDVCVLNYVNGMNSRGKKQKANVSDIENQQNQKPHVKKPKKVGFKERLASPTPSKPRFCLRWSLTGRIFDCKGKIVTSSESECQSDCLNGDNAFTSNPHEPKNKQFPNSTSFLDRLSKFVYGASTRVVLSI
nr:hypothetical protein [Tanacetum cinerariifolium]